MSVKGIGSSGFARVECPAMAKTSASTAGLSTLTWPPGRPKWNGNASSRPALDEELNPGERVLLWQSDQAGRLMEGDQARDAGYRRFNFPSRQQQFPTPPDTLALDVDPERAGLYPGDHLRSTAQQPVGFTRRDVGTALRTSEEVRQRFLLHSLRLRQEAPIRLLERWTEGPAAAGSCEAMEIAEPLQSAMFLPRRSDQLSDAIERVGPIQQSSRPGILDEDIRRHGPGSQPERIAAADHKLGASHERHDHPRCFGRDQARGRRSTHQKTPPKYPPNQRSGSPFWTLIGGSFFEADRQTTPRRPSCEMLQDAVSPP